jgi:hypothetical protein
VVREVPAVSEEVMAKTAKEWWDNEKLREKYEELLTKYPELGTSDLKDIFSSRPEEFSVGCLKCLVTTNLNGEYVITFDAVVPFTKDADQVMDDIHLATVRLTKEYYVFMADPPLISRTTGGHIRVSVRAKCKLKSYRKDIFTGIVGTLSP